MTAEVATKISDFLRDAQAKVGDLTDAIISLRDQGITDSLEYVDMSARRKALVDFMEILNDQYALFHDDSTTFIQAPGLDDDFPAWTDREVIDEIDWLRYYGQLKFLPFFVFVGYYPQVIAPILSSGSSSGSGWTPPNGNYLQILRYDAGGNLIAIDWPDYAGMRSLDINAYFTGRP